jgi:hypothetical protein
MARWLAAVHEDRPPDARYYAREIGVVGRLLSCNPEFRRMFAQWAGGGPAADADEALRGLQAFLMTVIDAAARTSPVLQAPPHPLLTGVPGLGAQDTDMAATSLHRHLVWSARECIFPRAGVYYGLAPHGTCHEAAAGLMPRRGSVYVGGRTEVRSGVPLPLHYFAVRDPSAVRVVPAKGRAAPEDAAHVSLVLLLPAPETGGPAGTAPEGNGVLGAIAGAAQVDSQSGFVMTIGLRKEREREFFEAVVLRPEVQPFGGLCERIQGAGDAFS